MLCPARRATSAAFAAAAAALFSPGAATGAAEPITVTFGEVLSDFTGPVRVGEARVAFDPENREVFVGESRTIRVFDAGGMQVYEFQIASNLGAVRDIAVFPDGSIVTLAYDLEAPGDRPRFVISRHDYRGVPQGEIAVAGLPPDIAGLLPNRMVQRGGRLVIASTQQLLAAEISEDGAVLRSWDLGKILGISEEERPNVELTGFSLDADGSLLATSAVLFRAFRIAADGSVVTWGKSGSAAGTFGIASGIASDGRGHTFVADKARKVVIVFDESLKLLTEFGDDPAREGYLGRPSEVFSDGAGRVYVTQVGKAGVFAYDVREAAKQN